MSNRKDRLARSLEIRDVALGILREHGRSQQRGRVKSRVAEHNGLSIALTTERNAAPKEPPDFVCLRFGLDIWHGSKVMMLEWDDSGKVEIVSFKRGDWERLLEAPSGKRGAGSDFWPESRTLH